MVAYCGRAYHGQLYRLEELDISGFGRHMIAGLEERQEAKQTAPLRPSNDERQ
jgi:hypothetical protein